MKIFFINNDGGGFADHIEIAERHDVEQAVRAGIGAARQAGRLSDPRQPPAVFADQVLAEGDRVSITPSKIQVAA